MKLRISFKDKEASLEANVEDLIEKGMDCDPDKKSRYQIRQEEKRKNREQRHIFESDPKRKTRYQIRQEEKRKAKEHMLLFCIFSDACSEPCVLEAVADGFALA